jgi:hypothetical protein
VENLIPTRIRSPDRPARSESPDLEILKHNFELAAGQEAKVQDASVSFQAGI